MICPKCGEQVRIEDKCCRLCNEKIQLSYSPTKSVKSKSVGIRSRVIQWLLYSSLTLLIISIVIMLLIIII